MSLLDLAYTKFINKTNLAIFDGVLVKDELFVHPKADVNIGDTILSEWCEYYQIIEQIAQATEYIQMNQYRVKEIAKEE